ncbi:MAG: hypothetical protein JNM18_10580 [Planctomycetaceae bacterium]|nr:hypothetical protein [Planctomycetaceae bacterium]
MLTASGCQSVNPMGEGFGGPMADYSSGMRKEADGGPGLGLSSKSREIERNLGYK